MINIEDMSFSYKKKPLFSKLDLQLGPAAEGGQIYGLLGLNGAGKTTLLRLLSGLLFACKGEIQVLGQNPRRRSPELLSQIFFLPEELNMPSISAAEYLTARAALYPHFDWPAFDYYIAEFGLAKELGESGKIGGLRGNLGGRKLSKLSYGQKKKFLLSFGLACCPRLLILDEPGNGLDIPSKGLFRRLLAEALSKSGQNGQEQVFLISTHQVHDVDTLVDSIIILHQGQVLFAHSMAEINQCLHMRRSSAAPDPSAAGLIYSEAVPGSYWSVWQGPGEADFIDLEILFKSIIARPQLYQELLLAPQSHKSRHKSSQEETPQEIGAGQTVEPATRRTK